MGDLLVLLVVAFASALLPVVNIEAYLGLRAALADVDALWALGLAAAVGQMVGKLVWYRLGASSLHWGWVRRRVDQPKARARLELWRRRTHERPALTSVLLLVSAFVGLPPFAVMAVLAGQLRMSIVLFLTVGTVGRWLRFTAVLGGLEWLKQVAGH